MAQLAAAGTILARGIPMVFMGQEAGEWMQFGQDDGSCATTIPAPATPGGTTASIWPATKPTPAARRSATGFARCSRSARRSRRLAWPAIAITHIHDDNGVVAFTRGGGKYLVVLNFRATAGTDYDVGVRGQYQELANTSWPAFNLGGYPERSRGGDMPTNQRRADPGLRSRNPP